MTLDYFNIEGQYGKNRIWSSDSPHQTWWGVGSLDWLGNLGSSAGFRSLELWYQSPEEAHKTLSEMNQNLKWICLRDCAPELFSPWAPAAEADAFLSSPAVFPPPSRSLTSSLLSRRIESKILPSFSQYAKRILIKRTLCTSKTKEWKDFYFLRLSNGVSNCFQTNFHQTEPQTFC